MDRDTGRNEAKDTGGTSAAWTDGTWFAARCRAVWLQRTTHPTGKGRARSRQRLTKAARYGAPTARVLRGGRPRGHHFAGRAHPLSGSAIAECADTQVGERAR